MRKLDSLQRARVAVTASFLMNGLVAGTFTARLPDLKKHLGLSNSALGILLFCVAAGVLSALKPAGKNAAKYGSKPMVQIGNTALAISIAILPLQFNVAFFAFSMFLLGFSLATEDVSMNTHGIAVEQKSGRRMMSMFHAFWSVGALCGGALGALTIHLGLSTQQHTLIVSAILLVTIIGINNFFLPADADKHPYSDEKKKAKHPAIFWTMGLLGFCGAIAEGSASDWGAILARDTFHATPAQSTSPYIAFTFTMVIGRFLGDRLAERFGAKALISISGLIGGIGLASGLTIGGITGITVGWFLLGLGVAVVIPLMFSAAGDLALKEYPGAISPSEAVAKVSGITYFGFVVGPPILGSISDWSNSLRATMFIPAALAILLSIGSRLTIKN